MRRLQSAANSGLVSGHSGLIVSVINTRKSESDPKAALQARRVLWKSRSIGGDAEGLAVCPNLLH
jgi:hypothetical protein